MAKLTRDEILKLAHLSRLRLSEEEIEKFRTELSEILNYVETLDKADTAGRAPTYQLTGLKNVTREDKVRDYGYKTEALLAQAPALADNQIKVKRVL